MRKRRSFFESIAARLPWLGLLLLLGLTVSGVSGLFEEVIGELPVLAAFQPLVLGMSGNAGTQSLAMTVRDLVIGGDTAPGARRRRILRELLIALVSGIAIGLLSFASVAVYLLMRGSGGLAFALKGAFCVGAAMSLSMMISGLTGAAIPILLNSLGVDPAAASGPLITTVSDLCALIGYYTLVYAVLLRS